MASWQELRATQPDLADAGERLLWQEGGGIAFLATVRKDGGPRVHPVAPILADGRLYVFVVNMSPKYDDFLRDGRYALHALPPPGGGEEFYVTGRAKRIDDPQRRAEVVTSTGGRLGNREFEVLFELGLRHVLHTHWSNWGTAQIWPEYKRWRAP